jgi:small GTP-binding protein
MGKFIGDTYVFKLLLVGDSTVGKSSLMEKYMTNYFPYDPTSTIGIDYATKEIEHMGKNFKLNIWDTAGQERFKSITTSYYRDSDCVILCYDITNRCTFEKLKDWISLIKLHTAENIVIFIVGTKLDLEKKQRMVGKDEAVTYAKKYGFPYCELSSKTYNYDKLDDVLFNEIVTILYNRDKHFIEKKDEDEHNTISLSNSNSLRVVGQGQRSRFNCCYN